MVVREQVNHADLANLQLGFIDVNSRRFEQMLDLRHRALDIPAGITVRKGLYVEDIVSTAQHLAFISRDSKMLVAGTRLTILDAEAQVSRFAVDPQWQGRRIGALLLASCEGYAAARGAERVSLWARPTAIGFYEKSGYVAVGRAIHEGDLSYPLMQKLLA